MQERREDDPGEAVGVLRADAVGVQVQRQHGVQDLRDPHGREQPQHGGEHLPAVVAGAAEGGGTVAGHAHQPRTGAITSGG